MALPPRRRDVWAAFVQFHHFCDRLRRWHRLGANLKRIECCSSFSVIFNLFFVCLRPFNYSQLFSMMGKTGRRVNNSWLLILTLRLFQQQWLHPFWSFDLWMFKCCPGPRHRPGDGVPAQEAVNILQWWEYSPRQIVRILARQCLYLTIRRRAFLLGEDTLGYLWHQWYKPSIFSIALTTIANYIGVIDFEILVESDIMILLSAS